MNREIKFRAFGANMMGVVESYGEKFCAVRWANDEQACDVATEDIKIMQFTGLKDKAGNEIYEGDICVIKNGDPFAPVTQVVVQFEMGCFGVMPTSGEVDVFANHYSGKMLPFFPEYNEKVLEVIGNLFEHPSLINPSTKS